MREVLNDKESLKNVILERVNEQMAADEVTYSTIDYLIGLVCFDETD